MSLERRVLTVHSLQDLKQVQKHLAQQRAAEEAREKARREAEARQQARHRLFELTVGPVTRLRHTNRVLLTQDQPPPIPFQHQLDEQRVLLESISSSVPAPLTRPASDAPLFRMTS